MSNTNTEKTGDEVITTVEERATKKRYSIRSRHVVACDGARSAIRRDLGIESEGEDSCATFTNACTLLKLTYTRRNYDDNPFQCRS
jgi:2-polyprenyl-6-methoxyphenol hydroxylase-like FAD-dependent oxidoreductase